MEVGEFEEKGRSNLRSGSEFNNKAGGVELDNVAHGDWGRG